MLACPSVTYNADAVNRQILCGALVIIAHIVEVERMPVFISLIGGMYGIASVVGPLVHSDCPSIEVSH